MMILRDIIDSISGLRYMVENLDIRSSLGKRYLLSQPFVTDEFVLTKELENISAIRCIVQDNAHTDTVRKIQQKLEQIHDINGTLKNISGAATLDDIELFEVKRFALLAIEIRCLLEQLRFNSIEIPSLDAVVDILDPDKQRIPHFYIYPAYSQELAALRNKQQIAQDINPEEADTLRLACMEKEDEIRQELSRQLFDYSSVLVEALNQVATLDVLLAKAIQADSLKLCMPRIAVEDTSFTGLFNPQVKALLQQQGKDFQPIDICLYKSPCLITGANMGGKTVLLKTIALSQYLFQFGFFVPAETAAIVPVEQVMFSMGDEQSELNGLSSFASEMLKVNEIIKAVKANKHILALIDELARTTNPEEGKAIVNATIDMLQEKNIRSLITSHYSGIRTHCRKLRVKGVIAERLTGSVTAANINDLMDYTLIDNNSDEVPMDALQIAAVMGVDMDLIDKANTYMVK